MRGEGRGICAGMMGDTASKHVIRKATCKYCKIIAGV